MSSVINLNTTPLEIAASENAEVRISNGGPGTVYYKSTPDVSSSSYDGTIASGASLTSRAPKWIVSTTGTKVSIAAIDHVDDTINVHGIADTSDLALISVHGTGGISVKDSTYGATGDGTTDDTTAVQAAINAAAALAVTSGEQVRVSFPRGIYLVDKILLKESVWLDFGEATIKQRADLNGIFIHAVEAQVNSTYYASYDDIKITGGYLDPNGKMCSGNFVRALWTRNLVIDGVTWLDYAPPYTGNGFSGTYALAVGGRNGRVTNCTFKRRDYGTLVNNDGIHLVHGTRWRISDNDIQSGDDAIVLGQFDGTSGLGTEPEAMRYITIANNVVDSTKGHAFCAYVESGKTGTNREITDVTVTGLTGTAGALSNAGIRIDDLNAGTAGAQIRRIQIDGVSLDVGGTTHSEDNPYGFYVQYAKDISIRGDFKLTDKTVPSSGFQLGRIITSDDVTLEVRCDSLGHREGLIITGSNRVHLVNSKLKHGSGSTEESVVITTSTVRVTDCDIIDVQDGENAFSCVSGSLAMRGTKVAHESGATTGSAFSITGGFTALDLSDNDFRSCINHGIVSANVTRLTLRNNIGISNERFTGRLFDDFIGDVIADQWTGYDGTDAEALAPVLATGTKTGCVRLTAGDDGGTPDMATNGSHLETFAYFRAAPGALMFETLLSVSDIDNVCVFAGLTARKGSLEMPFTLGASDTLTSNAVDGVGFLFDTAADTDEWCAVGVANNSDATKQFLGVAPTSSASTFINLRLEVTTAGAATFYYNGKAVGTSMAASVTTSVFLTPCIAVFSRNTTSKYVDVDYIVTECFR